MKTPIVLAVAAASLTIGGGGLAEATDAPTEWTARTVPHSAISVRYPRGWVDQPRSAVPPPPTGGHLEFVVADPGNGDNVLVLSYRGRRAAQQWFPSFDAYEANAQMNNARVGPDRQLISASAGSVDGMPVYRSIDRWHVGGAPVAVGDYQILFNKNLVIQFEATTDLDGQDVIMAIFDSIARSSKASKAH